MKSARVTSRNVPVENCAIPIAMAPATIQGTMDALNNRYLMKRMAFICGTGCVNVEFSVKRYLP
jgi:hypothetical protein